MALNGVCATSTSPAKSKRLPIQQKKNLDECSGVCQRRRLFFFLRNTVQNVVFQTDRHAFVPARYVTRTGPKTESRL
jgi:hypothetical protein